MQLVVTVVSQGVQRGEQFSQFEGLSKRWQSRFTDFQEFVLGRDSEYECRPRASLLNSIAGFHSAQIMQRILQKD